MEIYERIRDLRKNHLKMSQEEFGKVLGVSRSVINNIERNVLSRPEQKEPIYKLICKEFKVSYEWLIYGIEPMEDDVDGEAMAIVDNVMTGDNEFAKKVLIAFAKRSEEEWKIIERLIDDIKK